jgi:hypothetical protein
MGGLSQANSAEQDRTFAISTPSLYLLNAAALTKPHAREQLAADLIGSQIDVAIVTETHFKLKHTNDAVSIDHYTLHRRDRIGRRGGGVAVYVRTTLQSVQWSYTADNRTCELLWVRIDNLFIGAIYHPPRPTYQTELLLTYIEACVDEINSNYPTAQIVIAGDVNQLPEQDVVQRTGFIQIVQQPTRGANILDRIFTSGPLYDKVRVVRSTCKSDHKAVIAYCSEGEHRVQCKKVTRELFYRQKSPSQHALFLQLAAKVDFDFDSTSTLAPYDEPQQFTQCEFDRFYSLALNLLDTIYPERKITLSNRDPDFVTADIKAKLRRKYRLMRAGRVEEASALAKQIGKEIRRQNQSSLNKLDYKTDVKQLWQAVRRLTGKNKNTAAATETTGITAEQLNQYFAAISTDSAYQPPSKRCIVPSTYEEAISEWHVFKALDRLQPTGTGLDKLPAWFLRLGAPVFAKPLARLFNTSLANSIVPHQWKRARIRPIPKVTTPLQPSDFRPISVTPVLTRVMER